MEAIRVIEQQLQLLQQQGLQRRLRVADTPCAPRIRVDGRDLLAFCSNDYLGLAAHPAVVQALQEGAALYGAGSGASHLISGHSRAHARLEERLGALLAPHLEQPRAMYFGSGFLANQAMLGALATIHPGHDTELFSEELNHASLIDGARLSRARITIYPHNDVAALASLLAASSAKSKIVVTDSVYSMDGELAPLPALLALCEQHGAWLVVDDAHGFGTLGASGCGALEHFALRSPHLVYMGTLGKAAGVGGAFVAAHASVIELLLQRGRAYIYTTAAAPALAHALLTSIDIINGAEGMALRAHLQQLVAQIKTDLRLPHWQLLPSMTAVQPLVIGANQAAVQASVQLHAQGFWVPAIRPPTVAAGTARLRITLSAAHTTAQVASLIEAVNTLAAQAEADSEAVTA
jgi:8-amino-7-oxononanoate synthase